MAALGVVVSCAALTWRVTGSTEKQNTSRFSVLGPPGASLYPDSSNVAISPDGTMIAFVVGAAPRNETQLWIRSIDSMSARRLEEADDARLPFWSPDSRRIGFFTTKKLMTIAASGGRAETLADAPGARGENVEPRERHRLRSRRRRYPYRISASGGTPVAATVLDPARKESGHRFPTFLPDGKHFLYRRSRGNVGSSTSSPAASDDTSRVLVGSLDSTPVYAQPGWLFSLRQGMLAARPFDASQLKITGEPIPLPDEPTSVLDSIYAFTAGVTTSVSSTGTLAYFSGAATKTTIG